MPGILDTALGTLSAVSDRVLAAVAPGLAIERVRSRAQLHVANMVTGSWQQPPQPDVGYGRHGASRSKSTMLGWRSRAGNADEDIVKHLDGPGGLRERGRDLWMGTPIARGALRVRLTNVIGTGLRCSPQIDAAAVGISEEQADIWEADVERRFALWADSPDCDAARQLTFGGLQWLAYLSARMSGDVFALLPVIPRRGTVGDLCVQLIEADRICDPWPLPTRDADGSPDIVGGVEVGEYGEPVAVHVAPVHPGAADLTALRKLYVDQWKRIPIYGEKSGRRQVLHVMDHERPEQRRGVTMFAPVMEAAKQFGRYTQSELDAALVTAMLTVFVTSDQPDRTLGKLAVGEDASATDSAAFAGAGAVTPIPAGETGDETEYGPVELGSGNVVQLAPGESITPVTPTRPNAVFDPFTRAFLVQFGAALGIPYEILALHFTSSYTAARASFVEFWKSCQTERGQFAPQFCRPTYEEWLAGEVASGRIAAPGFFADPYIRLAWSGSEWFGPAQGQINEKTEAEGANARVLYGFSTREREAPALTGQSWRRVAAQRQRERVLEQQIGIGVPPAATTAQRQPGAAEGA